MKEINLKFEDGVEIWGGATTIAYEVANAAFERLKSMGIVTERADEERYMKNEIYEVWHDNGKIINLIRNTFSVETLKNIFIPPRGDKRFDSREYWNTSTINFEFLKGYDDDGDGSNINEEKVNDYIKSHLDLWHLEHSGQ